MTAGSDVGTDARRCPLCQLPMRRRQLTPIVSSNVTAIDTITFVPDTS